MIEDYIEYQSDIKKMLDASYKNNRLSHAYIFSGDKGVGKEAMALYFTALLNTKGNVCYDSDIVKSIFNHEFINLYEIAPKKNEIVKDDVQALLKEFSKTSLVPGDRVFIIHDADKLNVKTANMLLKFIEEPPLGVHGILLTSSPANIIPTIRSRCNLISFKSKDKNILYKELKNAGIEPDDASIIKELTNNIDEGVKLCESEDYENVKNIAISLLMANKEIEGLKIINDNIYNLTSSNLKMVLNIICLFLEDMLYDKPQRFSDYQDLISKYKKRNESLKIKERLEKLLEYVKMLDANVLARNVAYSMLITLFR